MSDEPKFFKRNFINNASILLASTGQATVGRIFDRDSELQWQSVGSDDATLETIQIDFKSAGINFLRSVDFLVVLGHNLANFCGAYTEIRSDSECPRQFHRLQSC